MNSPNRRPETEGRSARSSSRNTVQERSPRNDDRRQVQADRSRVDSRSRNGYDRQRNDRDARYRAPVYRHGPVVRPRVRIHFDWPWEHRYRLGWAPRYRYRQVLFVNVGWGRRHRDARLDVRTEYYHRVRRADARKAEIEIFVDRIEIYEGGRFLGEVRHIPSDLSRIRATVYRNGRTEFDRSVFLVGDPYVGFEMISTRYYDGYVLNAYRSSHGFRVGRVDLVLPDG